MMTEEEARSKWCPFANVYVPYSGTGAAGNRALNKGTGIQGSEKDALCIGSACMAWRARLRHKTCVLTVIDDFGPDYDKSEWDRAGYCGLAGKP